MAIFSRRHVLGLGFGVLSATRFRPARASDAGTKVHGLSAFGELKYPADFHHFDYVNVDAPKGGLFSQLVGATRRTDLQFAQRLHRQGRHREQYGSDFRVADDAGRDEPDAVYRLAAQDLTVSSDRLTLPLSLRPGSHVSRRHRHRRARRRVLAEHAEDQGASGLFLGDCATCRSRGRGPRPSPCGSRRRAALDVPALAASMPIFSEKYYATRPFDERRSICRSAPVPTGGALRAGALHRIRAGQKLVGRESSRRARTV